MIQKEKNSQVMLKELNYSKWCNRWSKEKKHCCLVVVELQLIEYLGLKAPAKPASKNVCELNERPSKPQKKSSRNRKPVLSPYCKYGASLEEMLHDRLVCGVNH